MGALSHGTQELMELHQGIVHGTKLRALAALKHIVVMFLPPITSVYQQIQYIIDDDSRTLK